MNITPHEMHAVSASQAAPRFDMYTGIHKALRALMVDTLLAVGRVDTDDERDTMQTSQRVFELLEMCASHLQHENTFVHAAMETRVPGSSATAAHEHTEHQRDIAHLTGLAGALLQAAKPRRPAAALALYRALALFVAGNLAHMQVEETEHNAVLWAHFSDAELVGIHDALLASIPPDEMLFTLRWMVPFLNPAERGAMLANMQAHAPAPAFQAALDTVVPHLTAAERGKLAIHLGMPAGADLVQV